MVFRESIEEIEGDEEDYYEAGEQLFDWIVSPFLGDLHTNKIENLVFVPATMFRSIPMSALYDGEEFLIENFAIVTSLGLNLTDPTPFKLDRRALLFGGISDSVQGFDVVGTRLAKRLSRARKRRVARSDVDDHVLHAKLRGRPQRLVRQIPDRPCLLHI